jgi:predicted Zn-dependent protease
MKFIKHLWLFLALLVAGCNAHADILETWAKQQAADYSDQNWSAIRQSALATSDPTVARVLAIGGALAKLTGQRWKVCVFTSRENSPAFSLPGYRLAISKELADRLSDDSLAWVMGHEMGHGMMQHTQREFAYLLGLDAQVQLLAGHLGEPAPWRKLIEEHFPEAMEIDREQELSADAFGVRLATLAGFDGRGGAVQFLSTLPVDPKDVSHPLPSVRLSQIEKSE